MRWPTCCLLALTLGCGRASESPRAPGEGVTPSARRIYWVGEAAYRDGRFEAAVALWKHALLQLPQTQSADDIRHQLLMRIAHGQLAAFEQRGGSDHLQDGYVMLQRYLERHEQLFGETRTANTQRGDIYELMYEFERRMPEASDELEPTGDPDAALTVPRANHEVRRETPVAAPNVDGANDPSRTPADPSTNQSADVEGDGEIRTVHVRTQPDVDDPDTREILRSELSDPHAGPVMTYARIAEVHGSRPHLRLRALIEVIDPVATHDAATRREARRRGRELLEASRPALLDCYVDALGRDYEDHTTPSVRVDLREDGSVSRVSIAGDGLIDGLGDVCLIEALTRTSISMGEPMTIELPLSFFVEGAVYVREWNGKFLKSPAELIHDPGDHGPDSVLTSPRRKMPPIEAFAR